MADNLEIDGDDRLVLSQVVRGRPNARRKWVRRILTIGIALGALVGFVVIVFNAYDRGKQPAGDKAAPVIKAEEGPMKVRPQQPGGMDVPNQDKQVYGRIAPADRPPQVEHLIRPPEVNVARPPAQVASPPPTAAIAQSKPEPVQAPPPPAAQSGPLPATPLPPPAPQDSAAAAAAPTVKPAPPPAPQPAAKTQKAVAAPATPARIANGRYKVQLASLHSEAAARHTWAELSKRHADLFGRLGSSVVRADLGQKGVYYRLQAGPLPDAAAAQALCNRAKQRKLGCIVVKP